jgi:hypothetical protein
MGHQSGQFEAPGHISENSNLDHLPPFRVDIIYNNMNLARAVENLAANKALMTRSSVCHGLYLSQAPLQQRPYKRI